MSAQPQTGFVLPKPVHGYHPGTFLERGAAVPFTTPNLEGTRARPGQRRALELTVPNPSGGRGVYIVPWDGIFALCRPTMHDCRLIAAITALRGITPLAIRAAARTIASEGLAGRAALQAAEAASAADERARLTANFDLLLDLVGQVELPGAAVVHTEREPSVALEKQARRAVARIAPQLGQPSERIAACLEELAVLFSGIGVGRHADTARVPRTIAAVAQVRDDMLDWARHHSDESGADASRIASYADVTLTCARTVLTEVQGLRGRVVDLLRNWLDQPDALATLVSRPDWLVDGWERICLLWNSTDAATGRAATIFEMVELLPAMPREAAAWARIDLPQMSEASLHRRKVTLLEDWRTGPTVFDLIARNERLRALAP